MRKIKCLMSTCHPLSPLSASWLICRTIYLKLKWGKVNWTCACEMWCTVNMNYVFFYVSNVNACLIYLSVLHFINKSLELPLIIHLYSVFIYRIWKWKYYAIDAHARYWLHSHLKYFSRTVTVYMHAFRFDLKLSGFGTMSAELRFSLLTMSIFSRLFAPFYPLTNQKRMLKSFPHLRWQLKWKWTNCCIGQLQNQKRLKCCPQSPTYYVYEVTSDGMWFMWFEVALMQGDMPTEIFIKVCTSTSPTRTTENPLSEIFLYIL